MEVSAPFSELSPASLIVQSSRFPPTEGKLASHCLREACLTGESLESRHAVRRSIGEIFVKPMEFFFYEWEHRTGKMCPFSILHPLKKGKEV